ncbi:MAG: DOMON-like domain-containing protein [Nostoc sp.]|uniref:DOMON-like domain-containing protein n=1 Tax=Nostoc sp. TaxID=1180 RepID=UPI002FF64E79
MNEQTFSLQPFSSNESPPNLTIAGNIARNGNKLAICYMLEGDLKEITIFHPSNTPSRKHELWKETCFEFFLGINNSVQYWEFNLSPAGHWNVYRLDGYRQGMQEETAFEKLQFDVQNQGEGLALVLDLDFGKIISVEQAIEVGITTVVKDRGGEVTYWALTHRGAEADFHLRDSFIIKL